MVAVEKYFLTHVLHQLIIYQFAYITIGLFSFFKTVNECDKKPPSTASLPHLTSKSREWLMFLRPFTDC